jgi:Cu/Ag efflux protein CusF
MSRFVAFVFIALVVLTGYAPTPAHAAPSSAIARIHGKIVLIDPARGTFMIHHDPFPAMPMSMTMEVEPKHHSDLRKLHVGEVVDVTIDTRIVPWPGTDIRPARPRTPGAR